VSTLSILVVEDDPSVRKFVSAVLKAAGHDVHVTDSLEGASTCAGETHLDVLVSDLVLGPADGHDVEEAVRMWQPNVKTLFMSGYGAFRERSGLEDPVLAKPFAASELLERIGALVDAA